MAWAKLEQAGGEAISLKNFRESRLAFGERLYAQGSVALMAAEFPKSLLLDLKRGLAPIEATAKALQEERELAAN